MFLTTKTHNWKLNFSYLFELMVIFVIIFGVHERFLQIYYDLYQHKIELLVATKKIMNFFCNFFHEKSDQC